MVQSKIKRHPVVTIRRLLFAAMMAFPYLGTLVPGHATVVQVTITGTVNSGVDSIHLFDPAATSLAGKQYTAVLTFDTALGWYSYWGPGQHDWDLRWGC